MQKFSVLLKTSWSANTGEIKHAFFNVSYTWYKSLTVPYINACSLLTYD